MHGLVRRKLRRTILWKVSRRYLITSSLPVLPCTGSVLPNCALTKSVWKHISPSASQLASSHPTHSLLWALGQMDTLATPSSDLAQVSRMLSSDLPVTLLLLLPPCIAGSTVLHACVSWCMLRPLPKGPPLHSCLINAGFSLKAQHICMLLESHLNPSGRTEGEDRPKFY